MTLRIVFSLTAVAATLAGAPAGADAPGAAAQGAAAPVGRVAAHSADWLAVGLVHDDKLSIRLSRILDNAPVNDAVVAVVLRGATYPTVAEADGSYALTAKDLMLPGEAAVEFRVTEGLKQENLSGVLKPTDTVSTNAVAKDDRGNGRQMWWWALNFGVCGGFLWLFSRRKKKAQG